jgi:lipopolysaccharide export system permease protein
MSILSRYILRRHIGPFLFANGVILFVFLTNYVMQNLHRFLGKGLHFTVILEVIALNLAWIVTLTIPMAVLVATLSAYGHLAKDNEIIAMRSGGISPIRITLPVLAASIFVAWGTGWFNNAVLPEANHRARLLMSDIYQKRPTLQFEEGIFCEDIPRYRILARTIDLESPWVYGLTLIDMTTPGLQRSIVADSGTIELFPADDRLTMTLYSGESHDVDLNDPAGYQRILFQRHIVNIPIDRTELRRSRSSFRGDREKSASQLRLDIKQLGVDIEDGMMKVGTLLEQDGPATYEAAVTCLDSLQEVLASGALGTGVDIRTQSKLEIPVRRQQQQLKMQAAVLKSKTAYRSRLEVEYYKKYSIPASCIVFIMIGAPLGMISGRGNFGFAGGLSLMFFVIFWGFLTAGEMLADRRLMAPFWAMWTPNILVGSVGIYLLVSMTRGSWLWGAEKLAQLLAKRPQTV